MAVPFGEDIFSYLRFENIWYETAFISCSARSSSAKLNAKSEANGRKLFSGQLSGPGLQ